MATQRYGQYCPISRALDLLGERWTLMIVRDMLIGATRFNDLARGLPGLSRSLLTQRLRMLERGGVVVRVDGEYLLTDAGQQLEPVVFGLGAWGARWTFDEPDPDELDAELLVWWIHMGLDTSMLAAGRHVFHVRFTDDKRRYWLVDDGTGPSMCHTDPGYPVDRHDLLGRLVAVPGVARPDSARRCPAQWSIAVRGPGVDPARDAGRAQAEPGRATGGRGGALTSGGPDPHGALICASWSVTVVITAGGSDRSGRHLA